MVPIPECFECFETLAMPLRKQGLLWSLGNGLLNAKADHQWGKMAVIQMQGRHSASVACGLFCCLSDSLFHGPSTQKLLTAFLELLCSTGSVWMLKIVGSLGVQP